MIEKLRIRSNQIAELSKSNGLWPTLKACLYENKEAIPVCKDLSTLKDLKSFDLGDSLRLVEISLETIKSLRLHYPLKSRGQKANYNLKKGIKSYALLDQDFVLADVWYVDGSSTTAKHKDLNLFQIDLMPDEVYMFDLYLAQDKRGRATATTFMSLVLGELKERGIKKAYGYFLKDNTPALWVHRLLGYEELSAYLIKRYATYEMARSKECHEIANGER
ncbi:hypothetical protein P9J64_03735 [Deltaproteobacteria bacterium IMCC39524]|nr:hypothetical protein [Deltaproteobacteria bacterium IMCC39524]